MCKASKVLPTMLMGFIIRGKRYGYGECACAVMLAFGASLFLLSNSSKGIGSNGNGSGSNGNVKTCLIAVIKKGEKTDD